MESAKTDTKSLLSSDAFCKLGYVKVRKNGWQIVTQSCDFDTIDS